MKIRKIAFTDFEMTGLDPLHHEIIEFGVVLADSQTLEIIGEMDRKVRPEHIETADPEALAFVGYREKDWREAISLEEALCEYSALVGEDTIFAAWNTPSDWLFLMEAFRKKSIKNPLDYHTLDVVGVAFQKLNGNESVEKLKLSKISEYFGIPKEPRPHRALNGARSVYEVYKKLRSI